MKFQYSIISIVILLFVQRSSGQEFIGPHGYLTLEAEISNKDSIGNRGTFDLHHFNLLGNYLLNSKARVFGEIEWEHGTDTESERSGSNQAGFVRLERAWFEYEFSSKFKLRLGKFLTPYGIYNEIHDAAPAYDTTILPQSIYGKHKNHLGQKQRFYAKFSIGIQASGQFDFGRSFIQYHFLLVNGRGKSPFEQDDNKDKGIGLRLLSDLPAIGLKLGYSFYTDRNGLANNTRQSSHAWDFRLEYKKCRLSGEIARSILTPERTALSNQVATAAYGELAYHVFGYQTILLRYDIFDASRQLSGDLEKDFTIGTSLKIMQQVVVKAEVHFWHVENANRKHFKLAIASLAVVF